MGLGPIPFTAIKTYHTVYGIEESFEDFLYVIRAMDEAFLVEVSRQRKEKEKTNATTNANKNH